jgi:hypothetical protein
MGLWLPYHKKKNFLWWGGRYCSFLKEPQESKKNFLWDMERGLELCKVMADWGGVFIITVSNPII